MKKQSIAEPFKRKYDSDDAWALPDPGYAFCTISAPPGTSVFPWIHKDVCIKKGRPPFRFISEKEKRYDDWEIMEG